MNNQLVGAGAYGGLPAGLRPDQAVYLDSPVISALRQIMPFFNSGMFSRTETPVFLQTKALVQAQLAFTHLPADMDIRRARGWTNGQMDLADDAVVFYPYNSASNMYAVANRDARHVLTLHGESNKLASNLPAARIYDYVSIAGPLARDRYLDAGIFTPDDIDRGRLVMMGDSYVQDIPWIRPGVAGDDDPALLFSPTWEGYGNGPDDYSSVTDCYGFEVAVRVARAAGLDRVIIKPHPFLGLLRPSILKDFVKGVKLLAAEGLRPELAIADSSRLVRTVALLTLPTIKRHHESAERPLPVKLAVCDVSGMEAVFLKQGVHHMVISQEEQVPEGLRDFYHRKAIDDPARVETLTHTYADSAEEVDALHRARVFGWQEPALETKDGIGRREWLMDYIRQDPFWGRV